MFAIDISAFNQTCKLIRRLKCKYTESENFHTSKKNFTQLSERHLNNCSCFGARDVNTFKNNNSALIFIRMSLDETIKMNPN